jgi:hypothetical protein
VFPLYDRKRRTGSGPLELYYPGEDRGLMDPSWRGGLRGSPSAKEGMSPAALLPVAGLGLAAKAGPAIIRGGQAAVAGADKASDFMVALMQAYKTLPPDKRNLAWRIIQEVIAKEVIQGSADSPDRSAEKQKGTVGDAGPVEFDPAGRLLQDPPGIGPTYKRNTSDIRETGHFSPSIKALENKFANDRREVIDGHELVSAMQKGGASREMELTDSHLDKNTKYTLEGALSNISPLKIGRHTYDESNDSDLDATPDLPGSGKWDLLGFRTIEARQEEFFRNNPRRFLYRNPTLLNDASLPEGGFPPESQPGGVTSQRHEGGAYGYKEVLFQAPIPEFLTDSPEFAEFNHALANRVDSRPDVLTDSPEYAVWESANNALEGRALKRSFPNHVYWSGNLEQHWPGEHNIIAHLRSDRRVIDGEYSVFGDEFQSDWQVDHDEALSGFKFLDFLMKDPEKFFSSDYDGFKEDGVSGGVLNSLGGRVPVDEGGKIFRKSLSEYYKILYDDYGIKVTLREDGDDISDIIETGDMLLDNPDYFDTALLMEDELAIWKGTSKENEEEHSGHLLKLKDIREAIGQRYNLLGNIVDKDKNLGFIDSWTQERYNKDGSKKDVSQIINQAMEDLPKSPYARTKDWTKLVAEEMFLSAANEGLNGISWASGDLKMQTNPGKYSEAKLKLVYDTEMKNQVIRSLKSLGVSKSDIDIRKVPYKVKAPRQGETARMWPTVETYVWKVSLTPEIIELIKNKGFKLSQIDPSKGGLLGQDSKRELYA